MSEGRGATLLGGLAVVLCPLVCLGLPLLVAAAIGAGLALAVGVAAGVALAGLGVGAFLALRRRRRTEACFPPARHVDADERSAWDADSSTTRASCSGLEAFEQGVEPELELRVEVAGEADDARDLGEVGGEVGRQGAAEFEDRLEVGRVA